MAAQHESEKALHTDPRLGENVSNVSESFALQAAIIGAQKAATSTLFELGKQHPEISACKPKEPHHFVREDWQDAMGSYAAKFPAWRRRPMTLEASTSSGFLQNAETVAERMYAHNPDMRIIYVVREPVARIVSAYRHNRARGWGKPSLEEALDHSARLINDTRYAACISPYRRLFGADHILVLTFDEVVKHQPETARRLFDFLGLSPIEVLPAAANLTSGVKLHHLDDNKPLKRFLARFFPRTYERSFKPGVVGADTALSADRVAAIRSELAQDIRQVEGWTGLDLSAWYE